MGTWRIPGTTVVLLALVTATPRARHPREKASSFPPLGGLEVTNVRNLGVSLGVHSQVKRSGLSWRCCSEIGVIAASFRLGPTAARTTAAEPLAAHVPERIVDCTAAHSPVNSPGDLVHCIQRSWVPRGCPRRAARTMEARERASKRPRRQRPTIIESCDESSSPHLFRRFGETVVPIGRFFT